MLKLFRYLGPFKLPLVLLVICVFGQVYANLALPDYTARIINQGIIGGDRDAIYRYGAIMLVISLIYGLFAVAVGFIASRIATGIPEPSRRSFHQGRRFFAAGVQPILDGLADHALHERHAADPDGAGHASAPGLMAPFMGIGAVIKAYQLAPSMTWIMAVAIGILFVIIATLFSMSIPRFTRLQNLVDRLNLVTREILTGMRVIRAFNREGYEEASSSGATAI